MGKIKTHIDVSMSFIESVVVLKDKVIFVLGIEEEKQVLSYVLKAYVKNQESFVESLKTVYRNTRDCHLHQVDSSSVIVLTKTIVSSKYTLQAHLIKYQEKKLNVSLIDNMQDILKLKAVDNEYLNCVAVSSLDNYLILANKETVCLMNIESKTLLCSASLTKPIKNFKLERLHAVHKTNDFIALSSSRQLFHIEYDKTANRINVITKPGYNVSILEIMKNLMVLSVNSKIIVFDLKQVKEAKLTESPIFKFDLPDVKYFFN